ncbi:HAD superfamily [Sesbania bispinosa]|nr:HAD superfamily [Sesbania bispinosa]
MHHGGKLMRNEDNELDYIGGEVDVWEDLDLDYINSLEDGLRELRWDCDTDVLDMCIASIRNDGEIEVFIEHHVVENPTFSKSRADVGAEETNEGGMDVPAEGEHVGDAAVEDHNDLPIPEEDNGSNFSDEEVEVEMGSGSSIRRKRAQSSDDMMSSDETDYGSEELSDQDNDDEDAQPVENFEVVAASMQIDDEESMKIRSIMVTGDNLGTANSIAREVEIEDVMAEAKPVGWKPSQPTTQETQGNQTPSDSAASAQGPQSEIDISQSQPTPQLDLSQNDNNSQQLGHPSLTPTADTTRTQPPTMTMGASYRPPAFPPHSAARPQVATQPANLRYRPPPVRGVTRQPLPTASPTSAANPLGTNMTFMPTPGYRAPPPPNP